MPATSTRTPAGEALDGFIRQLADRELAVATRRIRRHFLEEFLHHAQEAAGTDRITIGELMEPARVDAWLTDAAGGQTRSRTALRGRRAAAYPNSMRVRIDSYNSLAEFLGRTDRRDTQPPDPGYRLTPDDTERLLHDLAVRRPVYANAATCVRTAAVAALVADTGWSVPELARLSIHALHLDGAASVDLPDGSSCALGDPTAAILNRWLAVRAAIIAELQGSDPGHLWIPTKPGRPRGGREPVKPGLTPAAVRTLHAAHRTHVSQVFGSQVRPGAIAASSGSRPASGDPA